MTHRQKIDKTQLQSGTRATGCSIAALKLKGNLLWRPN